MVRLPAVTEAVEKAVQGRQQQQQEKPTATRRTTINSNKTSEVGPVQAMPATQSTKPATKVKDPQVVIKPVELVKPTVTQESIAAVTKRIPTAKHGKKFVGKPANIGTCGLTLTQKKNLMSFNQGNPEVSQMKSEAVIEDCETQVGDTSYGDFLIDQGAHDNSCPIVITPDDEMILKTKENENKAVKVPVKVHETIVIGDQADNIPGSDLLIDSLNQYITTDDLEESARRVERLWNILWLIQNKTIGGKDEKE